MVSKQRMEIEDILVGERKRRRPGVEFKKPDPRTF